MQLSRAPKHFFEQTLKCFHCFLVNFPFLSVSVTEIAQHVTYRVNAIMEMNYSELQTVSTARAGCFQYVSESG